MFKKLRKKVQAAVKKNIASIKKDIKKIKAGAKDIVKKVAKKITKSYSNAVLIPVLPFVGAMKVMLKKRNISTKGDLTDIVKNFMNQVVIKHPSFENLEQFDLESFENFIETELENNVESFEYNLESFENLDETATKGKEFDESGALGKGGGAALGLAVGLPPQAGAAIGGGLEKVIKAIVAFFKKKKADGDTEVEEALKEAPPTETEAAELIEAKNEGKLASFDLNKILFYVLGLVVLIFAFKKFAK